MNEKILGFLKTHHHSIFHCLFIISITGMLLATKFINNNFNTEAPVILLILIPIKIVLFLNLKKNNATISNNN